MNVEKKLNVFYLKAKSLSNSEIETLILCIWVLTIFFFFFFKDHFVKRLITLIIYRYSLQKWIAQIILKTTYVLSNLRHGLHTRFARLKNKTPLLETRWIWKTSTVAWAYTFAIKRRVWKKKKKTTTKVAAAAIVVAKTKGRYGKRALSPCRLCGTGGIERIRKHQTLTYTIDKTIYRR